MKEKILIKVSFLLVVVFSMAGVGRLWESCPAGDICELAGKEIEISGKIVSLASERLEKNYLEFETTAPRAGTVQVIFPHTQFNFRYGDRLALIGKLKLPSGDPEDNFSYPLYLAGKGIYSVMNFPILLKAEQSNNFNAYGLLLDFRERVRHIVNQYLPEPESSIINSMIIGDQGGVPKELRQKLSETGIIHILSVSGTHVTLMIFLITLLLGKFIRNRLVLLVLVGIGVSGYLLLAGSPNCASRSAIMGLLAYAALSSGRTSSFSNALWVSAAVLLYLNPTAIFADVGFELSFLAVLGMVYVFPVFDKLITWGRSGWAWNCLKVILLSIAIGLTTTPLVYYYFGIISWVSPLANLILLPLFSLALPLGFILIFAGFINPVLANTVALLLHFLFRIIELAVDWILKIPGSHSAGNAKPGWIILYYLILMILCIVLNFLVDRFWFQHRLDHFSSEKYLLPKPKKRHFRLPQIKKYLPKKIFENKIIIFWLAFVSFLLCISFYYLYCSSRPPRLFMLNVGQGDAFLLDWPYYHLQIIIDGGPGRRILPEMGSVLPFYDRKIEILILTHSHQDHIEGLANLLERYRTSQIIMPKIPNFDSPDLEKIFWRKIIEKKIPAKTSRAGDEIFISKKEEKITDLEFLSPFFNYSRHKIINLNDQSAVIKMNFPRTVIFTGDVSKKIESVLMGKKLSNLPASILKVGHHGSRFSTSDEFLAAVGPETALISVGSNNLYGHPAQETIKKLKNNTVLRTDLDGRVEINF